MRALPGRASRSSLDVPAPPRSRSSDTQRQRIRRATGELIAKRGYGGVTIELIVKRAHVSFKTFYNHYANKDECFRDLFDVTVDEIGQRISDSLAAGSESWPEQVAVALHAFFAYIGEEPLIARACIVEAPTAGPEMLQRYEQATKAIVPLLRVGRRLPGAEDLPDSLEETLAGSIVWSAYQRLVLGEAERLSELLPETLELVLRPYLGNAEAARIAQAPSSELVG